MISGCIPYRRISWGWPVVLLLLIAVATGGTLEPATAQNQIDEVSFSRDILPVLSDRCFHCHGPDESNRQAGLRLDLESSAKEDLGGYAAIVPGNLEQSELWRRINSDDQDGVMPPADSHRKPLSEAEREAISTWILSGARWGKHWSLERPVRPPLPSLDDHPIDAFIKARLAEAGMALSAPAPAHVQLRRLSLDLTGLSPSAKDVEAWGEGSEARWEDAIERLLDSPHHAERMAMWWLDAARYSDSDGYQQDATRQNWPWRDWVIEQFRRNRSFREFTIEQFAGDLLPDATDETRLATCFHRNHMTNGEGGRDPEESRIDYVIDRVNTTGTVWLGLTLGCVQCHSHKFDPVSQHDYYSMAAFFNSIDEDGKAGMAAKPYLKYRSPSVADRIAETADFAKTAQAALATERKLAVQRFESWQNTLAAEIPEQYVVWHTPRPHVESSDATEFAIEPDATVQTFGPKPFHDDYRVTLPIPNSMKRVTGFRIEVLPHDSHIDGRFSRDGNGEFTLTSVIAAVRRRGSPAEQQLELAGAVADFEPDKERKSQWDRRYANIKETLNDDARDGWTTQGAADITPHVGVYELEESCPVSTGDRFLVTLRHRSTHGHANIGRFRISLTSELGETVRRTDGGSPIAEYLASTAQPTAGTLQDGDGQAKAASNELAVDLRQRLLDQFLLGDLRYQKVVAKHQAARKQLDQLKRDANPRQVMVLAERETPRPTHVLVRGVWDAKGDEVQPGVLPNVLDWPAEKTQTRLDLAHWIVSPDNPLTARVVVNHLWQLMFGQGLVRTPEDFGLQGALPTHPKLLDWLAVELVEHDWDLRHILRLIATSRTYRQSSGFSPELGERDPENRLLARAPRFRLPAWMIRDNALRAAGLLHPAVGGPPVYPYQPPGVWAEITMGRFDYQPSLGPAQYRRSIYAFWRRSSAPTFLFDSAQRRVCEVGVRRTNTPLHALTLLNDVTMLEASRALADLIREKLGSESMVDRQAGFQQLAERVLSRRLTTAELGDLEAVWETAFKTFRADQGSAVQFCTVGQQEPPATEVAPQTAAWMTTASLLLNTDEAITRE